MTNFNSNNCSVAIIGLGYVGLPLTIAISKTKICFKTKNDLNRKIIGFDKNLKRINDLKNGIDNTNEVNNQDLLENKDIEYTSDKNKLANVDLFLVALPTPIDKFKNPDLSYLKNGCEIIGNAIKKRTSKTKPIIIFESTVYPGCTEEFCIPIIENTSGFKHNLKKKQKNILFWL